VGLDLDPFFFLSIMNTKMYIYPALSGKELKRRKGEKKVLVNHPMLPVTVS